MKVKYLDIENINYNISFLNMFNLNIFPFTKSQILNYLLLITKIIDLLKILVILINYNKSKVLRILYLISKKINQ